MAEWQAQMTEAEFVDWLLYWEHQNDMAERQREGLSMHDGDNAEDMTQEESVRHVTAIFSQLAAKKL